MAGNMFAGREVKRDVAESGTAPGLGPGVSGVQISPSRQTIGDQNVLKKR